MQFCLYKMSSVCWRGDIQPLLITMHHYCFVRESTFDKSVKCSSFKATNQFLHVITYNTSTVLFQLKILYLLTTKRNWNLSKCFEHLDQMWILEYYLDVYCQDLPVALVSWFVLEKCHINMMGLWFLLGIINRCGQDSAKLSIVCGVWYNDSITTWRHTIKICILKQHQNNTCRCTFVKCDQ